MLRIPNSALERAIMRRQAQRAADRAIYMRQRRNEILNRFRPSDEEIDEILLNEDAVFRNRGIPHYIPDNARRSNFEPRQYEQRLPYYPGRDAAPRQRTLEYDFDRDYDPYGYEELL